MKRVLFLTTVLLMAISTSMSFAQTKDTFSTFTALLL